MKITENIMQGNSVEARSLETYPSAAAWPVPARSIAPWWHTVLLVAFLATVSLLTSKEAKTRGFSGDHVHRYLFGIGWEWLLAALAWWGIRIRHVPVRQLLGRRRAGWKMWARDFGVAMIFWLLAVMVLAAMATILRLLHQATLQKAVIDLAPNGGLEIALWLALCISAGIVEEFVFRGYLLQQFASLASFAGRAERGLWVGILASSLVFGISHGYEGVGGMLAVTAYGAMFCALAVKRNSLRAGMMAHAWHDSLTGIVLTIVKHLRAI
jgi:uncharacterized protein